MKFTLILVALCCLGCVIAKPARKERVGDEVCNDCQFFVSLVENYIESNSSIAEIEEFVELLCKYLPTLEQVCDQVAVYGIEWLVNYIETNEDPLTVCSQFKLCSSKSNLSIGECDACFYLVDSMETWANDAANQAEIEYAFDQVCEMVPAFADVCEMIVSIGFPEFVAWLQTNENATTVCQQLHLCKAHKPLPSSDLECEACTIVIGALEDFITENSTEAAVQNFIDNYFCSLAGPYSATCDAIVDAGLPQLVSWIQQNEDPAVVCQQLNLCTSHRKPMALNVIHK